MTMPLGAVISSKLATLHELDTVYGVQDMWDLLEIVTVDNHNSGVINGDD